MAQSLAIFASGSGSNAEEIIKQSLRTGNYHVALIVTNNPGAGVINRGARLDVPVLVLSKKILNGEGIVKILERWSIDFIVLAGYLNLIPDALIRQFSHKIINIHPALLPSFGGKGMYGDNVHKAVIDAGEKESGITIHEVNEKYDEGKILFQASCPVLKGDTPESLAERIHSLEHQHYPVFLEYWVRGEIYPGPK